MPKILPDFDSCGRGARCPGVLDKLERRADDTEDVIRERYLHATRERASSVDDAHLVELPCYTETLTSCGLLCADRRGGGV